MHIASRMNPRARRHGVRNAVAAALLASSILPAGALAQKLTLLSNRFRSSPAAMP